MTIPSSDVPVRIFIVEDHPLMRDALVELIGGERDFLVCGSAASAEEALESLPGAEAALLLVDLSLPGISGIELIAALREAGSDVKVLVVSGHEAKLYARPALVAGATGYVMKDDASEVLTAVRVVLSGKSYFPQGAGRG